jgi:hypothetical protein
MLRRITLSTVVLLVLVGLPLHAAEWTGWITDEHCGAKGASEGHKGCALKCADGGAALVFYNPADEKVYKLSDQAAAKANVGHKVKVVGTIEGETITVQSISEVKADS